MDEIDETVFHIARATEEAGVWETFKWGLANPGKAFILWCFLTLWFASLARRKVMP